MEGVAEVTLNGDREPLVRVLIDPNALAARGLTVADLETALDTVALDAPAGSLSGNDQSLLVRADASVASGEEVEAIRINTIDARRRRGRRDLRAGGADRARSASTARPASVSASCARRSRTRSTSPTGVRAAVDELNAALPEGVTIRVTSDDATFIGGALEKVLQTLARGDADRRRRDLPVPALVRATIIPALTVPIALIGTLAAIYLAGFSLNILTLLAIVLATGLVVDDAIVVLENIERHRAHGHGAARRRRARRPAGVLRRDRHHGDARRGVHPDLVLPRHGRPALLRVRLRHGLRGGAVDVRRADAHARCSPRAS